MVWKNSKNKKYKLENLKTKVKKSYYKRENYKLFLKRRKFSIKSGIINGLNKLTGKKIKNSFADRMYEILKLGSSKKKLINKWKSRRLGIVYIKKKLVARIKDNSTIAATFNTKPYSKHGKIQNLNKRKYIHNVVNWKNKLHTTSFAIINKQESYLQSNSFKVEFRNITFNSIETIHKKHLVLQDYEHYNTFIRQINYKNLLFRSFWFHKFISTLIKQGKKQKVWKYILESMSYLKIEFGRSPVLMLFEILEMYKMPIKGITPKVSTKKVIVRTHLVSWWKQYTQILRWIRHSLLGSVKNHISWNARIKTELYNLLFETGNSLIKKRIETNLQLIAFGRVALHFRWHRRYNKRAVKAIKILDKKFY